MSKDILNLMAVPMLVVDSDRAALDILAQMLRGFGAVKQHVADSGAGAAQMLEKGDVELMICELGLNDIDGVELIRGVRQRKNCLTRGIPIIALTGYAQASRVSLARDAGANIVIKKPLSAQILFDRLAWISHTPRPFIETATYVGPDRRFRSIGPPNGIGRRSTDLPVEVGVASEPNMSQDEIDAFIKPMKVIPV